MYLLQGLDSMSALTGVSKIEDYKVFLNPKKIAEFANPDLLKAAKDKVVKAWKDGGLLTNERIFNKFKDFDKRVTKKFDIEDISDFEDYLMNSDNWFYKIFTENL